MKLPRKKPRRPEVGLMVRFVKAADTPSCAALITAIQPDGKAELTVFPPGELPAYVTQVWENTVTGETGTWSAFPHAPNGVPQAGHWHWAHEEGRQ